MTNKSVQVKSYTRAPAGYARGNHEIDKKRKFRLISFKSVVAVVLIFGWIIREFRKNGN